MGLLHTHCRAYILDASAAICYDDHERGEMFVVSQCGHMLCRDAARLVALAAIKCVQPLSPNPFLKACSHMLAALCSSGHYKHSMHVDSPGVTLWIRARDNTMAP